MIPVPTTAAATDPTTSGISSQACLNNAPSGLRAARAAIVLRGGDCVDGLMREILVFMAGKP